MKQYLKNRLRAKILRRSLIQIISLTFLLFLLVIIFILRNKDINISLLIISVFVLAAIVTATSFKRKFKINFNPEDTEVLKLIIVFMRMKKADIDHNTLYLQGVFNSFKHKHLFNQINLYKNTEINQDESMLFLSESKYDLKMFLVESLLDIALSDGVLSNDEERFINKVGKALEINSETFENIKLDYIKKGLNKETRGFNQFEDRTGKQSFNLMTACQTLNITPTISSKQLKKAYRTLAKKYHPDRYHGRSEEVIQNAQIKFHEIKTAYEIIVLHKGF